MMFGIGSIDRRGTAPGADASEGWRPWLEARLAQNTAAQAEPWAEGVAIVVRSRKPDFMKPPLSWIVPVRKERTYQLDAVGSRVWELCGKRLTVEEIVDLFAAEYDISFHEPTGNLDLHTGEEIIDLLSDLSSETGVTVISATHDHKMLDRSDRILWIRDGQKERLENRADINIRVGSVG